MASWCLPQASGKPGKHKNLSCCCGLLRKGYVWGELLAFGATAVTALCRVREQPGKGQELQVCGPGGVGIQAQVVQKYQEIKE